MTFSAYHTSISAIKVYVLDSAYTQKRRRCLFLSPILGLQAFALPPSHRIDNAEQPTPVHTAISLQTAQVLRRRFGCHLPVVTVEVAKFIDHNDRRSKTSFSYICSPLWTCRSKSLQLVTMQIYGFLSKLQNFIKRKAVGLTFFMEACLVFVTMQL